MRIRNRLIGSTLALFVALAPAIAQSTLMESREVLPFLLDSIRHVENGPAFTLPWPRYVQTQTLHFAGFDTSLGTLQDAYLSYEGTYAIEYVVKAGIATCETMGRSVGAIASYSYALGLSASGAGTSVGKTIQSEDYTTLINGFAMGDELNCGMYWFNLDGSGPKDVDGDSSIDGRYMFRPWVTSGDLNVPLLGLPDGLNVLGQTVDVTFVKDITQLLLPFFSSSIPPTYSVLDNYLNKWSGSVALTYVYESDRVVPTPEPASLLLVVTGLIGVATVARRGMHAPRN